MPKTLSKDDPNLLKAVDRLTRAQRLYGWLLVGLGIVTQVASGIQHPVAGTPFIAIGLACLLWGDPALFAAVAVLMTLSIFPTLNGRGTILGPEPIAQLTDLGLVERAAIAFGKLTLAGIAVNQFFLFRLLYGTARATSNDPDLPIIPPMVPNRTDRLARGARSLAILGVVCTAIVLLLLAMNPFAFATRVMAEIGGSLGAVAIGLGLGSAFSPTDERPAALLGVGLGAMSYVTAAMILLRLP
jgi:hypothetical protein